MIHIGLVGLLLTSDSFNIQRVNSDCSGSSHVPRLFIVLNAFRQKMNYIMYTVVFQYISSVSSSHSKGRTSAMRSS